MDGARNLENPALYDRDFHAWAQEQARLLKAQDLAAIDLANVIEEIEASVRAERSALRSTIANILEHLIKLDHGRNRDPERQWRLTVNTQRRHAVKNLKNNPSLRPHVAPLIAEEYVDARRAAPASFEFHEHGRLAEYEAAIPIACPYAFEDVIEE